MRFGKAQWFALAASAVLILGGCAHPQAVKMGATEQSVVAELGEPQARTPMPDGTVRLTYSTQPMGQEVWWLFVDKKGLVVAREQGLQEKYFGMLKIGESTERDVWAMWGTCAQKYPFPIFDQHAWMYRFRQSGMFDMAVWPQFDKQGILRSLDVTDDPWKRNDSDNWLF